MVHSIHDAFDDCSGIKKSDWDKVIHAVHLMRHPIWFAIHVAKDLVVNGVTIFHDIEHAIDNWKTQQYLDFGENVGEILEKIFIGEIENGEPYRTFSDLNKAQMAQVVNGVLMGALKAEHADDLTTCLADAD